MSVAGANGSHHRSLWSWPYARRIPSCLASQPPADAGDPVDGTQLPGRALRLRPERKWRTIKWCTIKWCTSLKTLSNIGAHPEKHSRCSCSAWRTTAARRSRRRSSGRATRTRWRCRPRCRAGSRPPSWRRWARCPRAAAENYECSVLLSVKKCLTDPI